MLRRLLSSCSYRVVITFFMLGSASVLGAQPYAAPKAPPASPARDALAKTTDSPATTSDSSSTGPFFFAYDEAGRLIGMVDAVGNTATYTYDAAGNVLSIVRGSAAVSILAFSPKSGPVGTNVTIVGAGFGATVAQNAVTFNGVSATVVTATRNQLVAVVPGGATTGPIRVTSPTGSAVSTTSFTVGPGNAPSISGFTPTIGTAGSTVTIMGTNFEPVAGNNKVSFNGNLGATSSATATSLGIVVPSTATSGHITVSTPTGKATSTGDFFVPPAPYTAADVAVTGRMAIGETRGLTISQANKIGLVVFSGSAGQWISLGIGLGNSCHSVSIRRPDGLYLVDSTFVCGSPGFIDRQVLPVSGTYLITFDPTGAETGTTTLTLYNVPPDATAGIVPGGSPVTVTTTIPGQNAVLTFAGSAGQRISLAINNVALTGGSTCGYVSILRPDGSALVDATVQCASGFIDLQVLPVSGTYRITFDPFGADIGSATLRLYNIPPDVPATIIPGGSPVTVTTTIPGQNAVLTFAGSAGQRISLGISVGTAGGCGYLSILRPDGSALVDSVGVCSTGFIDLQVLPVSGTYRITFDPFGADIGSVTLRLYNIPPDVPATIIPGGSPVTVTTTIPGQNAVLTFAGSVGQRISLAISVGTTGGCGYLSMLRPDGTALVDSVGVCSTGFIDLQVLPVSGTYRITFDPFGADTGSATLRLYNIPPDVPVTIVPGGSPVTVTTTIPGQNAVLTFAGSAGQRISLGIAISIGTAGGGCGYLSILRPDGSALVDSVGVCSTGFIDLQVLPVSGTYRITFDPFGADTGSATLRLYNIPPDVPVTIVPGGSPVTVTTTIPGQNAVLTFAGSAGQRISLGISISVGTAGGGCGYLSILRPDGSALVDSVGVCSTGFIDLQVLPVSGTYRITFDPFGADTGSATLRLYNIPPDVPATIIPGGSPVTVTTTIPGQNAVLTFAGSAGQRISLGISVTLAGSGCGYVSILQPDGATLDSVGVCSTGFIDLQILPVSGTYRITFDPFGADTGSATLTLYAAPTVTSISPRSGTTLGGTRVVITGSNFQNGATVSIGGVPATGVSVVANTITATTGAHATGTVSVSVTNPDNRNGTLSNSYFYDQPSGALSFYSVSPCRLVDTRKPSGPLGGPPLEAGTLRVFTAIGSCGIPTGAKSLSVNVTVSAPTTAGFLSLYPGNAIPMGTSSLSFSAGQTRGNNAVVKLSTDGLGTFAVQNGASGNVDVIVDVIVDVNGYFM